MNAISPHNGPGYDATDERVAPWDEPALTGELAHALAKAQAEMTNPVFDSVNPHFKNKFASLAAVRNSVVPVLTKHGIAMTQDLRTTERGIACYTTLMLGAERLVFGPLTLPATKADAQGFGSAATYARRYHLMAVAGVVGDADDDANAATDKPANAVRSDFHDPRGDLGRDVPTDKVDRCLSRVADILASDKPDLENWQADRIYAIHQKLNEDQDLYVAVQKALVAKKILSKARWDATVQLGSKRYQRGEHTEP